MYLAIDTSTDNASLAIIKEGLILAELSWFSRQNHSVELMPNLNRLLDETKTNLKSTEGIIVAIGPGSFNGLRVGLSTAKGLAFSLGIPLVGINTLESAAYQYAECELPICPIFSAGRGEIATAIYQNQNDQWRTIIDQHITTIDKLITHITKKTIFCGEPTSNDIEKLKGQLEQKARIASPASRLRRAVFLAELGIKRIEAGNHDTPANLEPIYLRQPPITQPKNPVKIKKPANNERGNMEKILVLIKPDAMRRRIACNILSRLENIGLKLVALKMLQIDKQLAQKHYAIHREKPFFNNLVDYISSAPIAAAVFEGDKAIERARETMGATDPKKAEAGTIRGDFGVDIEQNSIHGSDSIETAKVEIGLFFNEEEIFSSYSAY